MAESPCARVSWIAGQPFAFGVHDPVAFGLREMLPDLGELLDCALPLLGLPHQRLETEDHPDRECRPEHRPEHEPDRHGPGGGVGRDPVQDGHRRGDRDGQDPATRAEYVHLQQHQRETYPQGARTHPQEAGPEHDQQRDPETLRPPRAPPVGDGPGVHPDRGPPHPVDHEQRGAAAQPGPQPRRGVPGRLDHGQHDQPGEHQVQADQQRLGTGGPRAQMHSDDATRRPRPSIGRKVEIRIVLGAAR